MPGPHISVCESQPPIHSLSLRRISRRSGSAARLSRIAVGKIEQERPLFRSGGL